MIVNWKNVPLIRLVLPLIGGILIGIYGDLQTNLWSIPLIVFGALLGGQLLLTKYKPSLRKEFVFGALTMVTFFFIGVNLIAFKTAKNKSDHYQNYASENYNSYLVEVSEIPKEKPNSIQVVAEVYSVKTYYNTWKSSSGNVLLYFKKDSTSEKILQGDQIIISSNLQDIAPPHNPGQFNYKQYLSFNQIYQQGFVQQNDWKILSTGHFSIISYASNLRNKLLNILKKNGLEDDELGVASALILGYKDDLDNELKHSYSSAGATHVLAVSGLHVGIIFLAISFVLGVFDKSEKLTFIRLFIVLFILWSYATITGLSPSVVRAATMFSFVAIGKAYKRDTNIYNTLAGSALVLLIINPYLIMEVGFQLSYLAVLGIVYFQKIIYKRIYIKNKIGDYIWTITSVSIAAQLTTFPLGLLYFHQFPTYFFISNLVVIPAAVIIIALGLALFTTAWIPPIAGFFGLVLTGVIYGMNWVVRTIDSLPVSLIEGVSITILECWMIYMIIVLLVISKESRKLIYLNLGLGLFAVLLFMDHVEDQQNNTNREIAFYDIKGEPNINFIDGYSNELICSDHLMQDRSTLLFNIKHHWFDLDLNDPHHCVFQTKVETNHLVGNNNYYQFYDHSVYHYDGSVPFQNIGTVDILYISAEKYHPTDQLLQNIKPEILVLSNGCNWKYRTEFEKLASLPFHYHDIKKQGAYVKSF